MGTEMPKKLPWVLNAIDKKYYAPFTVERDCDYYGSLRRLYTDFCCFCVDAGADSESVEVLEDSTGRILNAVQMFYRGKIGAAHEEVKRLVEQCGDDELAFAPVNSGIVFPGRAGSKLQLFHARVGAPIGFKAREMLHLPYSMRGLSGSYRFSIPGLPSYYLANSSYGCWIELGQPAEHDFNVSPVLLDCEQKVFNLAVMGRDLRLLNELDAIKVRAWLKLVVLMFATSYTIKEPGRTFKSEYLISQSVMLACKDLGLDGVAYYSKRVADEVFARAAINLALFTDCLPGKEYGDICRHIKVGDSFNYMMFRQLGPMPEYSEYELRSLENPYITCIGSYDRQRNYRSTDFCAFDKYLFGGWETEPLLDFGNALKGEGQGDTI